MAIRTITGEDILVGIGSPQPVPITLDPIAYDGAIIFGEDDVFYKSTGGSWAPLADEGAQGAQGVQGIQGIQGIQGQDGAAAAQGIQGETGIQGPQGIQGIQGQDGAAAAQGIQGETGIQGPQGIQGIQGPTSAQGTTGIQGDEGVQGIQGLIGPEGIQGSTGAQGAIGAQGEVGARGNAGGILFEFLGTNQADSDPGNGKIKFNNSDASLVTFLYVDNVSYDLVSVGGYISTWAEADNTYKGNIILSFNSAGDNSFAVFKIISVASTVGYNKIGVEYVSGTTPIDGNVYSMLFTRTGDSGIQGITGAQGPEGAQGATGAQGTAGAQGTGGTQGAAGAQGAGGVQGAFGPQGIQGIQGRTGTQGGTGTQGTLGIQGSTGAQGAKGSTGAQGATGTQGIRGLQGIIGAQGRTGSRGLQGIQGIQGLQGRKGSNGTQGTQGIQGSAAALQEIPFSQVISPTDVQVNPNTGYYELISVTLAATTEYFYTIDFGYVLNIYNNTSSSGNGLTDFKLMINGSRKKLFNFSDYVNVGSSIYKTFGYSWVDAPGSNGNRTFSIEIRNRGPFLSTVIDSRLRVIGIPK